MKQIKPVIIIVALLITLTFTLPSLLVLPFSGEKPVGKLNEVQAPAPQQSTSTKESTTEVAVLRSATNNIEKLPIEEYVIGVVASEMPVEFEPEALKAQALTARTYITSHLINPNNGNLPEGVDVSDTVNHQVFKNQAELKKSWGKNYEKNYKKIERAVKETQNKILTYKEKPITASFFSASNGYTENAEDYWENQVPYLKSVKSPWDSKESPEFESQMTLSTKEFEQKLGVKIGKGTDVGTILARTPGKKVAEIEINGKKFTGREIREKLELRSTDFSWIHKGDSIIITTKGYGHGIGMSQYGANGMAKEGKDYQEIVNHYYKDVKISDIEPFFDQKLASTQ
ncbi:stage II sporulation protein D [Lederbergia lenta]|uniref:Stage II sporulation protein D n=1 Tax=Lederbergia lenta TaxID=1467 RepID=A0A2X4ZRP2_LEDLE|nr:stage II sporulation protein D [Lederbergia lenta]MCM3112044.1 stage II sporulation protein D [Lederbergia lenta]MEC2323214.1 stage II sporulation protein D [Lederbergia lenta]SQI63034.1 stage II sporulation protein D [Lederbergia lenta]